MFNAKGTIFVHMSDGKIIEIMVRIHVKNCFTAVVYKKMENLISTVNFY
jgi:hypothetical protein